MSQWWGTSRVGIFSPPFLIQSVSTAASVLGWEWYSEKPHCGDQQCAGHFRVWGFSGEIQTNWPEIFPSVRK